jgi:hypothetical protein
VRERECVCVCVVDLCVVDLSLEITVARPLALPATICRVTHTSMIERTTLSFDCDNCCSCAYNMKITHTMRNERTTRIGVVAVRGRFRTSCLIHKALIVFGLPCCDRFSSLKATKDLTTSTQLQRSIAVVSTYHTSLSPSSFLLFSLYLSLFLSPLSLSLVT